MREYKKHELYPHTQMLSSTQFLDYCENPSEFYIRWVLGIEKPASAAMEAGKAFSELYADPNFAIWHYLEGKGVEARLIHQLIKARKYFPVLPPHKVEHELICEYKGWKFRATLDGFPKIARIVENKTSSFGWDQMMCDISMQITFQAWVHWIRFQKIADFDVNVVDTRPSYRKLVYSFKTKRSKKQLLDFQGLVDLVIKNLEAKNFNYSIVTNV